MFSWAYRAADGRRHDFTFLNQGTFFLKWGTFFLLFLTFTKIKVVHIQGDTQDTNRYTPPIRSLLFLTFERQKKERKKKGKRTTAKEKRTAAKRKEQEKNRKKKDRGPWAFPAPFTLL